MEQLDHHRDIDGRPPVGDFGSDPLLDALIRAHPDLIPAELLPELAAQANRRRVILAAAAA